MSRSKEAPRRLQPDAGRFETPHKALTLAAPDRQALITAASQALPIGELDAQSFGDPGGYGTHVRPGMLAARRRAIRFLGRAAELASDIYPGMDHRHIETALRSLRLYPADLLVNPLTGEWLSTKAAVAHRGREVANAIAELALVVEELEQEGAANL